MMNKGPTVCVIMRSFSDGWGHGSTEPVAWSFDYDRAEEWIKNHRTSNKFEGFFINEVPHVGAIE